MRSSVLDYPLGLRSAISSLNLDVFLYFRNTDYVAEHGAARNFEPWRDNDAAQEEDKLSRLEEEENNPMAALENKAVDSKREMDILDALQELKTRNARIERAGKEGSEKFLERVSTGAEMGDEGMKQKLTEFELKKKQDELDDEEEVRKVFGRAYVAGVPDIELENGGVSSSEDEDTPGTPKDGEPIASGSGSGREAPVKRKLEAVEPTPASLLSAASRSIVEKSFGGAGKMGPPLKKKAKGNSAMAKMMGLSFKK